VARVAGVPCWWLVFVARTFARLPGAAIPWPRGTRGSLALALLIVAAALLVEMRRLRVARRWLGVALRLVTVVGVIAGGFAIGNRLSPHTWPPRDWVFAACDVGQGEAVVARSAPGAAVLVDTGPSPPALDQCLIALGVQSLPSIVLTGGSSAAIGGLPGALHARTVGAIDGGPALAADAAARVSGWVSAARVPFTATLPGVVHVVGDVRWRVLADFVSARVVVLSVAGITALVAGDVDIADEAELVSQVDSLKADVLVVPHHGAAKDVGFLHAVHPGIAIVSVGRGNSQHDPSADVLQTLSEVVERAGRVVRTDQAGGIAVSVSARGPRVVTRR
jgi:competence protein ComEC